MTINYRPALKNARLDAVTSDAGTAAVLKIYSSGYSTLLATFPLNNPIAAAASGGVLTLSGFPKTDSVPDANGTAALARIEQGGGTVVADGLTVGTSSADIILSSTTISTAVPVTLNSATITHP